MKKIRFIKNERTLEILEAIAKLGFILFLGIAAPNAAGHIIKLLGWVPDTKNKYRTERVLTSLENKKFIRFWVENGKGKLELTKEGKIYLAGLEVKKIKLPTKTNWDGLWRIITFDIPEKLKTNRRRFTRALIFAGMYNLEKSIFVYPHECKEQTVKIAKLFEVEKYIKYIVAKSIEPDFKLKINFPYTNLKK
jgi:PaaX-like protein C-terminal domain.